MLNEQDLIKMATEEMVQNPNEQHNPIRKAYDAVTHGAVAAAGAIGAGVAGIQSLDNKAPVKTII